MSKGKRKPKLSDLSRTPPNQEERAALSKAIDANLHPVAAAIIGAVFVEHELENQLRRRILRKDDDTWKELLSENGPLRTFSAKITMGFALRIFGEEIRDNLDTIRNIRNVFAHSKRLVDFDHELITKELRTTKTVRGGKKYYRSVQEIQYGPKVAYLSLCVITASELLRRQTAAMQVQTRYWKRKATKISPLAQALVASREPFYGLMGLQSALGAGPTLKPLLSEERHIDGPKSAPLGSFLSALFQEPSKTDGNEGK